MPSALRTFASSTRIRRKNAGESPPPAASGRYVFVVITYRQTPDGTVIPSISARYMHQQEVELYEQHRQKALAKSPER